MSSMFRFLLRFVKHIVELKTARETYSETLDLDQTLRAGRCCINLEFATCQAGLNGEFGLVCVDVYLRSKIKNYTKKKMMSRRFPLQILYQPCDLVNIIKSPL